MKFQLFFRSLTGSSCFVNIDEGEEKNTVGSIIPRIALKSGNEYDPEENEYRVVLEGKEVHKDELIEDFADKACKVAVAHFIVTPRPGPEQNRWHALCLEKFTTISLSIIKIIISYSAARPKALNYTLPDNTKAGLRLLFSVFRRSFNQFLPHMTATELMQQLDDENEVQYILEAKGSLTNLAQQLIARITVSPAQPGSGQDIKQLTNDVFSLVSAGVIPYDSRVTSTEARIDSNAVTPSTPNALTPNTSNAEGAPSLNEEKNTGYSCSIS